MRKARLFPAPYPGLRPFQLNDSAYFFGRDHQADEIIARLRKNRFLSVIGGSGSGKSSLVLAGVIPGLRSFAILESGDFWIPVVSTPGTNHVRGDSPVQRLARAFCLQLEDIDQAGIESRITECASLLRQKEGLKLLVERFSRKVKHTDGVDLAHSDIQVNFLFLIDQFEEIFHSSNVDPSVEDDCAHLVNRILEQFKCKHSQTCVALTMRSEHLNDCPRYQDLPDAINATFYLVKRLNEDQLREAIIRPAQHYLRNVIGKERQRARRDGTAVAQEWVGLKPIIIAPDLVKRLLDDSKRVLEEKQDHADQLPLLQHILFWIWNESLRRCTRTLPIPSDLTLADLYKAVHPGATVEADTDIDIDKSINVLVACLENRCEAIYRGYPEKQGRWKDAFLGLAYKEPNTGVYTQQRAQIDSVENLLRTSTGPTVRLREDLSHWLQPHSYLYWDDDSGTIKVAHETLIRRWKQFRDWIDAQDRQLQLYMRLLEDVIDSRSLNGATEWTLLEGESLSRYLDAGLLGALTDPIQCERLEKLLGKHRERDRFLSLSRDAKTLLELSRDAADKKRTADVKREKDKARKRLLVKISLLLLVILMIVAKSLDSLKGKTQHISLGNTAALTAHKALLMKSYHTFYEMQTALSKLKTATTEFDQRNNTDTDWIKYVPGFGRELQQLEIEKNSAEANIIDGLSATLRIAPWPVVSPKDDHPPDRLPMCTVTDGTKKFQAPFSIAPEPYLDQGLVIINDANGAAIYLASIKRDNLSGSTTCQLNRDRAIYTAPKFAKVQIGLDNKDATLLMVEGPAVLDLILFDWEALRPIQRPYASIQKTGERRIAAPNDTDDVFSIKTERQLDKFSIAISTGHSWFRAFFREPQQLASAALNSQALPTSDGQLFLKATAGDRCSQVPMVQSYEQRLFQLNNPKYPEEIYCLQEIAYRNESAGEAYVYFVKLYSLDKNTPTSYLEPRTPIAGAILLGKSQPAEYRIVSSTWLTYKIHTKGIDQWFTTPWTLDHWKKLAEMVREETRTPSIDGR